MGNSGARNSKESENYSQNQNNSVDNIRLGNNSNFNFSPIQNITAINIGSHQGKKESLSGVTKLIADKDVSFIGAIPRSDRKQIWSTIKRIKLSREDPRYTSLEALKLAFRYCAFYKNGILDPDNGGPPIQPDEYRLAAERLLRGKKINLMPVTLSNMMYDKKMSSIYRSAETRNEL